MTKLASARCRVAGLIASAFAMSATSAFAQAAAAPAKLDGADTAWMISATSLVLMMSIPGLALFYAGMVRKKNVLSTMTQVFAVAAVVTLT